MQVKVGKHHQLYVLLRSLGFNDFLFVDLGVGIWKLIENIWLNPIWSVTLAFIDLLLLEFSLRTSRNRKKTRENAETV